MWALCAFHTSKYLISDLPTDCTPYLLQLGLTKSRTSLVWIAGPLSGIIMQPVVGVLADNSRSKWGRRRPFMVGGAVIVALCLLVLGWTAEIVGLFVVEPDTVGDQNDQTPWPFTYKAFAGQIMHYCTGCTEYLRGGFCYKCWLVMLKRAVSCMKTDSGGSPILLSKSDSRYPAHIETTTRVCLG